jgi:2-oxoglutarate ferredoxin oxidoreductase subunit alpha
MTEVANAHYNDPRQRQLMKNIIYLGALSAMLGLEPEVIERLFVEMYKGKEKLLDGTVRALHLGRSYAQESLPAIGLRVERRECVGDLVFVEGNAAAALGAVYGGATVCAWYPITPSSSVAEAFEGWCRKLRHDPETGRAKYAIVQAEDELASIGMVIGAGWNGARAFTATSGPGISLMTEFLGLAYFAEIPATIINVQRGGPSTGMPTRTQQADILACAYAGHGDTKHVLLFPEDPAECFDFTAQALDLADRLQTPIFVMTDLDIGMNRRLCAPLNWDDSRELDVGKIMTSEALEAGKDFGRYLDVDGDGIPYRTLPGTHPTLGAYFTRGTTRNAYAKYSETGTDYVYNMERLLRKFDTAKTWVPQPVERPAGNAVLARASGRVRFGALQFGSTSPAMSEAHDLLEDDGIAIDVMRIRAFPFADSVQSFIAAHEAVFVIEQNRDAQMRALLVNELGIDPAKLISVLHYDGTPITARFIHERISDRITRVKVTPLKRVATA